MKTAELREMSAEELHEQLERLYKDRFNYRMRHGSGQLNQSHLLGEVRRDIARVKTLLNEMGAQAEPKPKPKTKEKEPSDE